MSLDSPDKYIDRLRSTFPAAHQEAVANGTHPVHIAFLLINQDVQTNGTPWTKCLDCGQPYVIGEDGAGGTFCSLACETSTTEYLANPDEF